MYTVLIVDDEEPVLDSYAFLLDNRVPGFRLAGKARSGFEAIWLLYELKPDIVFMDINMPGMDGLETISQVHDKFPDTVFVLSTAYERFDIARRAIPLGVFAYLVKPVNRKVFAETLESAGETLSKRRLAITPVRVNDFEHKFLQDYIWKDMTTERWLECREQLGLDTDKGFICIVGLDSEQEQVFTEINTVLELKYRFFFSIHLNLGMYFFPGALEVGEIYESIRTILLSVLPPETVSLTGLGTVRDGQELHLSCREAFEDLNRKKTSSDVRLRERMRIIQIRRKIGLSECEEIRSVFTAFWEEIFASYNFNLAKGKMISLFTLLIDDCTGCYQSHQDESPPFLPAEEIMPIYDVGGWRDWAEPSFTRVHQMASQKRTGNFPSPLVKALAFIEEKFTTQIQLPDAALAANVSGAYLSRLFAEHMDSNFIDYLTVMRIERAEKLIRENRMNIKEVSVAVGYQDPNYFSKIFRKIVGVSPSMYAERNRI